MAQLTPKQRARLERELILWLTTVTADGQPQSHPVWYVLDGDDLLMWSIPGERSTNLESNQLVAAHVNDNGRGGDVLTIEGTAIVEGDRGIGSDHGEFVRRYQPLIDSYNSDWAWFDGTYTIPVRIRPTRVLGSSS